MENSGTIYKLIGQAIGKIGAIGKDRVSKDRNGVEQFNYRGIDQVYNALNPVMAELGLFFCPRVLDQKREERTTRNGAVLTYTILSMEYTVYAPDGSSVVLQTVGEAMDSGDKSTNKAMSVALKYAMFQLFCIPTEEMKDPDADVYNDILPKGARMAQDKQPQTARQGVTVTTGGTVPPAAQSAPQTATQAQEQAPALTAPPAPETPAAYIKRMIGQMQQDFGPTFNFMTARKALIDGGQIPNKPSAEIKTMEEAKQMIGAFYDNFGKKAG